MSTAESGSSCLNFKETELTLALPGEARPQKSAGSKRGFSETTTTIDYLKLGRSSDDGSSDSRVESKSEVTSDGEEAKPPAKAQVVGWPPVRAQRKNQMSTAATMKGGAGGKYVKVAVDGAPYLRKLDLETYTSYHQLLSAFHTMFSCLTIRNVLGEKKLSKSPANGAEYVPTYEDKDGDWMLVGDVPWKMFVESCKRMRLMKSSEAIGLAPRTPSNKELEK